MSSPRLEDLLRVLVENRGSDLHIQCDEAPLGRINGDLGRFEMTPLTEADVMNLVGQTLGTEEKVKAFLETRDCDAAVAFPDLGRFRANLFFQRNKPGIVLRQ